MSKDNLPRIEDNNIVTEQDAITLAELVFKDNAANTPRFRKALRTVAGEQIKRGVDLVEFDTGRGCDAASLKSLLLVAFPHPYVPSIAGWVVGEAGVSVFNISLPCLEKYQSLFLELLTAGNSYPEMIEVYLELAKGTNDQVLLKSLTSEEKLVEGVGIALGQAISTYYEVAGSCLTNEEGGLFITGLGYADAHTVEVIDRAAQAVLHTHPVLADAPAAFRNSLRPNFSYLGGSRWVAYGHENRFIRFNIPEFANAQQVDFRSKVA